MAVPREQVIVQFTPELLAALDDHVGSAGKNRSEVIRDAVQQYLKKLEEEEMDRRLIEAYTRMPQEDWSEEAELAEARELIEDEDPW